MYFNTETFCLLYVQNGHLEFVLKIWERVKETLTFNKQ